MKREWSSMHKWVRYCMCYYLYGNAACGLMMIVMFSTSCTVIVLTFLQVTFLIQ
jgi:hypothetical protein